MILPYTFKLRHTQYQVGTCNSSCNNTGWLYPTNGYMEIAIRHRDKPRKPKAIELTFWHEAVHAILFEMDSSLWNDEEFVTDFSKLLVQLINTARFK